MNMKGRPRFCWICGRNFWGNRLYTIVAKDLRMRYVHKSCGEENGYDPKPSAYQIRKEEIEDATL